MLGVNDALFSNPEIHWSRQNECRTVYIALNLANGFTKTTV